jgi:hypothetical protein
MMLRRLLPAILMFLLSGCGGPTEHAGGSTDTGNTVVAAAGTVLDSSGAPAGRADLSLRRRDYLSPIPALGKSGAGGTGGAMGSTQTNAGSRRSGINLLDTVTDASGAFRLDSLDSGSYRLEVRQGNALGLVYDMTVAPAKEPLALPGRRLGRTAKVVGGILLRPDAFRGYVQVYGMERLMAVNTATGRFEVPLPAGDFTLRFIDPDGGSATVKTREISLDAGDSLDIGQVDLRDSTAPYREWSQSRRLWINTSADGSGAGVAENVLDFPMLVRLDSSVIDFGQASPTGADLRFTKAGGKVPVAYEIERWDSAAKRAEVWVRMDTVKGGASDQYVHMHWGNPSAKDSSNGSAVFDTALGFAGVWHLEEGSNFPGFNGYMDATANGNKGQGVAISDTTVGPGAIGMGQELDGAGAYIRVADAPSLDVGAGDFLVSAWARPDAIFRNHQLVSKRVDPGGDYEFQVLADGRVELFAGNEGGAESVISKRTVAKGEWHLFAMRRIGVRTEFWVDGVLDTSVTNTQAFNLDNNADFFIGHDAQNLPEDWQGGLDEVRLARKAMSPAWLRLSFKNQEPGSRMISLFRP